MPTPRASFGELDDERGRPTTLREWAHLYTAADEFMVRAQTGEAAKVLVDVEEPLAEVEEAGVADLIARFRFVVALANLQLGQFDDAIAACNRVLEENVEEGDPAWVSSMRTLRGIAHLFRGDNGLAVTDLINAAVDLDEAPPVGQNFVFAVNGLGVGYKTLRLYELALEEYQRAEELVTKSGYSVSRVFHAMNQMLIEAYWGMELDRLGRIVDAANHFRRALALADGLRPLPPQIRTKTWDLRLRARTGLCRAMLGEHDRAIEDLEPTVETMARMGLDEEPMARIGLVRAYGDRGDRVRANIQSEHAVTAADKIKDVQLVIGAGWERVRNATAAGVGNSIAPGIDIAVAYAQQLESVRWDERERFVRETRDRLDSERERRAARKMSVEYLTDSLTGLANRRHLEGRLPEMVARAATNGESVTLAFIDLDGDVAPDTLVSFGARLREALLPDGFLARWEGAEFVLVVPRRSAGDVAMVVRAALATTHALEDHLPASVGVAEWRTDISVPGLVTSADEALLAARRAGGGIRLARPNAEPVPPPVKRR